MNNLVAIAVLVYVAWSAWTIWWLYSHLRNLVECLFDLVSELEKQYPEIAEALGTSALNRPKK